MRKMLQLSAVLALAAPAAFAQSSSSGAAPAAPSTPAETAQHTDDIAMQPLHHSKASSPASRADADIRPGHTPGVGDSYPASTKASNITAGDSRSEIAPRLPAPAGGDASPATLLGDAQKALAARQSGRAQEALERAETAMLQRSVPADQAAMPDQSTGVVQIRMARDALAKGDMTAAKKAISAAMAAG